MPACAVIPTLHGYGKVRMFTKDELTIIEFALNEVVATIEKELNNQFTSDWKSNRLVEVVNRNNNLLDKVRKM